MVLMVEFLINSGSCGASISKAWPSASRAWPKGAAVDRQTPGATSRQGGVGLSPRSQATVAQTMTTTDARATRRDTGHLCVVRLFRRVRRQLAVKFFQLG